MSFIEETLRPVPLPDIVRVEQVFDPSCLTDVEDITTRKLRALSGYGRIQPGMRVAVTAGSRAIHAIDRIIKAVVDAIKARGAEPFIIPAMGSHGGATAEGQKKMVESLGITEEAVGAPIRSTMDVVQIGNGSYDGRPVFLDRFADEADGIVIVNRIKPHTSFRGDYESGLMKMMAIGIGKQHGAQTYHQTGFRDMSRIVEAAGLEMLKKRNILFGIGILENARSETADIVALDPESIPEEEKKLLKRARAFLPKLFCSQLDVLAVQKIGKDISGTGIDSNVTGRYNSEHFKSDDIEIRRIALLRLSEKSKGNANGMGMADFITKKLYDSFIPDQTYPNALTSTAPVTVKIPMVLENDMLAVKAAVKTSMLMDHTAVRMALIESTKNMSHFYISTNMLPEARDKGLTIHGAPFRIPFSPSGDLELDYSEDTLKTLKKEGGK